MSGNLICKSNAQLFSFQLIYILIIPLLGPQAFAYGIRRARAGPGLGPSLKTGLAPSKKGWARVGLRSGLGPDPSLPILLYLYLIILDRRTDDELHLMIELL